MAELIVGKSHTTPSKPSHVKGVREGNEVGSMKRQKGIHVSGWGAVATAQRSTGIRPGDRNPIDPRMPNLTPP